MNILAVLPFTRCSLGATAPNSEMPKSERYMHVVTRLREYAERSTTYLAKAAPSWRGILKKFLIWSFGYLYSVVIAIK